MYYVQLIAALILFHGVLLLIVDGMLVAAGLSRR
jgi:hypothetical protein